MKGKKADCMAKGGSVGNTTGTNRRAERGEKQGAYAKGGTVRGTGAATKGKNFSGVF